MTFSKLYLCTSISLKRSISSSLPAICELIKSKICFASIDNSLSSLSLFILAKHISDLTTRVWTKNGNFSQYRQEVRLNWSLGHTWPSPTRGNLHTVFLYLSTCTYHGLNFFLWSAFLELLWIPWKVTKSPASFWTLFPVFQMAIHSVKNEKYKSYEILSKSSYPGSFLISFSANIINACTALLVRTHKSLQ